MASAPTWQALDVQIPGKDILKDVRQVLETLVLFLDIAKTLLNVIKTFLVAIGNPIKALVQAIIGLITSLIEALKRSGFYSWFLLPDFSTDPNMKRLQGGYPGFVQKWKGSLLDNQDINRPRPVPGFNTGGFVMIVADTQGPAKLIRLVKVLLKFFGSSFTSPQYGAPSNTRVLPASSKGDPLLAAVQWAKGAPEALAVEWSLPTTTGAADPGFSGLVAELSTEFYPPQWLVERTTVYPSENVLDDFSKPGRLLTEIETDTFDPRTNQRLTETTQVFDEYGQPVLLMEEAFVINASNNSTSFFLGQLGKFRFLDKNVQKDKPYWYRIRAFSGKLAMTNDKINFTADNIKADPNRKGSYYLEWPSADPNDAVVMGQSSPIIPGRLPTVPPDFDVVENLRRIFLAAFSLNFQLPLPVGKQKVVWDPTVEDVIIDATGNLVVTKGAYVKAVDSSGYPIYEPVVDTAGNPIPPYTNVIIGQGALSGQAGPLAAFQAVPVLSLGSSFLATPTVLTEQPWTTAMVRWQAARLMSVYTGLMLEAGGPVVTAFRTLMQGSLPFQPFEKQELREGESTLKNVRTLEELVFALTKIEDQPSAGVDPITAITNQFVWVTDPATAKTYGVAFQDSMVRKNVLAAVNFVKTLGYQGQPPDWQRISLLQDMLPWSAQLIYEMLAKIQALVDAFNGLLDEIVQFITMITRKIEVLEKFIEFLITILNFIEQLSAGFYMLFATGLSNGIPDWFKAIDESGGDKPKSTLDGGYTVGLCLAYLAPDVGPLEAALKLIF